MMLYTCDAPPLTVAEDGQTAKGVWISSRRRDSWREGDARPQGYWRWGKYASGFYQGGRCMEDLEAAFLSLLPYKV